MSFCSQWNVKHDGKGFVSTRVIVFEIRTYKFEKLPISGTFDLSPIITGSNFDRVSQNSPPIASTHRERNPPVFSAKLHDAYFGKAKGDNLERRRGKCRPSLCAVEDGELASVGEG